MGYRPLPSLGSVGQALRNTSSGTAIWGAPRIIDITKAPYNADPTGVVDAASALNTALALNGVIVTAPAGSVFKVNSTVVIGNGSISAPSTTMGSALRGEGLGGSDGYFGGIGIYQPTSGMKLVWGGASGAGPVIKVAGPMVGWGLSDLMVDCQDLTDHGIDIVSGQFGEMTRVRVVGANTHGIYTTTVGNLGGVNTMHNRFQQITVELHDVQTTGIGLYSGAGVTSGIVSNTCFNVFDDITFKFPDVLTGGHLQWGFFLDICDSNTIENVVAYACTTARYLFGFGYLTSDPGSGGTFPNANFIQTVDTGGSNVGYVAYGTIAAGAAKNKIVNISPSNGGSTTNPSISGLTWGFTAANP